MIKDILQNLKTSSTLRINEISKDLENQGKKIFKFGFGQSPFPIPDDVEASLKKNSFQNKYLSMQGLLELRDSIANFESKKKNYIYKSQNIIVGPGSKELMFLLQLLFDGEILLPAPSWVSYKPQAIIGRNKFHFIDTNRDNNWFPSPDSIEKIVSQNKNKKYLLFLNSPNNPCGLNCENLEELSSIIKKYNLIVLSDEIYSDLSFENNYQSISEFCPEQTIISNGLSKWCGAGGWRLGYFVIPDKLSNLIDSLKVLASETFTSVSSPIQYAAISAFENDHDLYLKKSRNILKSLGNYMFENLKSNNVLISKPQGGFYIMPEFLNKKFISSEKLCEDILDNTGVASLPGSDFGFNSHKMIIRLSFTDFDGKEFMKNILDNTNIDHKLLNKYAPKIVEGTKRLKAWVES
jgi:aspartate aminotransferase